MSLLLSLLLLPCFGEPYAGEPPLCSSLLEFSASFSFWLGEFPEGTESFEPWLFFDGIDSLDGFDSLEGTFEFGFDDCIEF